MKIRNTIHAGMKIQIFIFSRYAVAAISPHRANAPLSHIKIFAGLILKNINATSVAAHIHNTVVARYLCEINKATANVIKTKIFNHPANPSNQSVIFTALTMNIVQMKVKIGNPRHRCIVPNRGAKFI